VATHADSFVAADVEGGLQGNKKASPKAGFLTTL